MEVKKGYIKTEIGTLPVDWALPNLIEVSTNVTDGEHATPIRTAHGYYLLSARNILNGKIDLSDVDFVGLEEFNRIRKRCNPEPGDVIISCSGTIGRVAVLPEGIDCVMVRSAALVKPDLKKVDSHYIQYYLQSYSGQSQILRSLNQGAQANLFINHIENLTIPLPPTLTEQRAIAAALSDADALLAALERLIAKKKAIKQGAMQELLTGRRRLEGFEGAWEFEHTELGLIPKDWKIWSLKECIEVPPRYGINAPAVPFSENLPQYLRITDISDSGHYIKEGKVSVNHPDASSYFLSEGDVVLARTGASVGKSYQYDQSDGVLVYAGFLIKIKPDQSKLLPSYLKAYLGTNNYWNWVSIMSVRSGQPGINGTEYGELKIPLPPTIDEQRAIAQILTDMDAEITALEQQRDKYKAVKAGMMQELLTGKTRLI